MSTSLAETTTASEIFSSPFLISNIGAPLVIGLAVGYFAKKMLRTMLFLGGAVIVLLFAAEYYHLIDITDEKLLQATSAATEAVKNSSSFLINRLGSITSKGISAASGFLIGFKLG